MRFSRQGYWSGLTFPSPGGLPNPGIESGSPVLQADALLTELQAKPNIHITICKMVITTALNPESSLVAQRLKHLPPMRETRVRSLGPEDPLEKEVVTHSSILA